MEELALFFRIVISVLFFSTAWSKRKDLHKHILLVQDYKILPKRAAVLFAQMDVWLEFGLAFLLLTGLLVVPAVWGVEALLLLYSTAILVNLIRGRREVSCGCGGVAGTHHLSWWLIWRNALLGCMALYIALYHGEIGRVQALWSGELLGDAFGWRYWTIALAGAVALIVWAVLNELRAIWKRVRS